MKANDQVKINWKLIGVELKRVDKLFKAKPYGTLFIDRNYKKDLEWWILGRMRVIVNKTRARFPRFAVAIEENGEPDFYISKNGKTKFKKIEVTEVLKPGRKRSDEYKGKKTDKNNKQNIWATFHERLEEKFKKDFGKNVWLIIYHNIRYVEITPDGVWHNTILAKMKNVDFSKSKYEKIFVINSGGKAAVSIYPVRYIVYPELKRSQTLLGRLFIRDYNKLTDYLINN